MPNYDINGYAISDFVVEGGGNPYLVGVGDRIRLPPAWSVSTDAVNFQITDNDGYLQGDAGADNSGDDTTQDVITTDAGGDPLPDGRVFAENSITLIDGDGHEIVVYVLAVGGTIVGAVASEPLLPGVTYEIASIDNVNNANAPDYVALESASAEQVNGETTDGGGYGDSIDGGSGSDAIHGGGGHDTIEGGSGNDYITGGSGDDTLSGGSGADYIDGDADSEVMATESLNWSLAGADDSELISGFTQNTGEMDVTVTLTDDGDNNPSWWIESSDETYTQPGEPMSDRSTLDMSGTGSGANSTTRIEFAASGGSSASDEVDNVVFRINGIDWSSGVRQDVVTVNAYDALGNPVTVVLTAAGDDVVTGQTVTAGGPNVDFHDEANGSVLVEIAGPVQEIEIIYSSAEGTGNHSIWVTDVHYDVMAPPVDGDDDISGGSGADTIDAGAGADTIDGGSDNDYILFGEGGATQADGDLVYGGTGDDTIDDVSGFNHTYNATIYGETGNDVIYGGDGDNLIDGGDDDDVISAEAGDDRITGGAGNDILSGGAGDDTFVFETGSGQDTITDFDMGDDDLDGFTNDQLDVSGLLDAQGNPLHAGDVMVTDDGSGNALLTFPTGESVVLWGVAPSAIDQPAELHAAGVPCFTAGTRIMTPGGEVQVEDLRVGDYVTTLSGGPMPLLWVGRRRLLADELNAQPELRPIRIRDGTFGNRGDLLLSPQHAMRLPDPSGGGQALVRAVHLMRHGDGRIRRAMGVRQVEYVHLLLPRHALVLANGAASESLYPGRFGLAGFALSAKAELFDLFPQLSRILDGQAKAADVYGPTTLPVLQKFPQGLVFH